jgi:tetratricopeptide (TPR) repeat protein
MFMTPRDLDEVRTLCASQRYDEALKLCAEFIAEQPDHPHGYHMRAVVRVIMGEPHLALADRDHLRVGNFAAAADDLDRAEKLDQAHYWPLIPFLRALCRAKSGRVDEALADAAKVPDDYLLPGFGSAIPNSKQQLAALIEEAQLLRGDEPGPDTPDRA